MDNNSALTSTSEQENNDGSSGISTDVLPGPSSGPSTVQCYEEHLVDENPESNNAKKHAALFILALNEKHRLTQTSINFPVDQVESMVEYTISDIQASVEEKLRDYCHAMRVNMPDLTKCFSNTSPFSGLESEYMQNKLYREHFNLIVSVGMYVSFQLLTLNLISFCVS